MTESKEPTSETEEFVSSVSNPIPSVPLNVCCSCENSVLKIQVNYSLEQPAEYYAFVFCGLCSLSDPVGSGIFSSYYDAVADAQKSWNNIKNPEDLKWENFHGQKNTNKGQLPQ